ncbi:hypothetical protein O9992_30515 [Vibrio lentus]|nr:hypothetical protein [Vibrio lentus]
MLWHSSFQVNGFNSSICMAGRRSLTASRHGLAYVDDIYGLTEKQASLNKLIGNQVSKAHCSRLPNVWAKGQLVC